MRHVHILATLVFLFGAGHALAEDSPDAGEDNARPHAIDVAEPAGAEAPPDEAVPPEEFDEPTGSVEAPPEESAPLLDAAELDQLVAPIALYPDALLAQVLIAATYPLEVVDADRFVKANPGLKGEALNAQLAKRNWDDSVKALVEAPEVLAMMSAELDWMQSLGDAVLAQESDVMAAVQRLRAKAEARGKLASTEQQKVIVNEAPGRREIVIQPAQTEVVYVPYYQPAEVYGPWPYPQYPPYAFAPPPPRYGPAPVIATGIAFGAGYALGRTSWGGFDWRDRYIRVYRPKHGYAGRNYYRRPGEFYHSRWQHNAYHRRGVNYKNPAVWRKYAKGNKPRPAVVARPKPGYAAPPRLGGPYAGRPKPGPNYGGVHWGQGPKAKQGAHNKFAKPRVGGAPKLGKPPMPAKQFARKPPGAQGAISARKPNAKFNAPRPGTGAKAVKPRAAPYAAKTRAAPYAAKTRAAPYAAKTRAAPYAAKARAGAYAKAKPKGPPKQFKATGPRNLPKAVNRPGVAKAAAIGRPGGQKAAAATARAKQNAKKKRR